MSDELAPDEVQDKPDTTEPEQAGQVESTPEYFSDKFDPSTLNEQLAPAYKQMHGAFTKKSQALAEQRKELEDTVRFVENLQTDPQTKQQLFRQLAEELGFDVQDDDEPVADQEHGQVTDPRLDVLLAREEERQMDSIANEMLDHIDTLATGKQVELTAKQRDAIFREAAAAGAHQSQNGKQITQRVFDEWLDDLNEQDQKAIERYRQSKRAPRQPSIGQAGQRQVNLSDAKERRKAMAEAVLAAQGDDFEE